ncbi:FKBP-type peptidyl-prolyl cis-trans isomerase [Geminisphaera colitermitum]|uniref:FKBP-type peptidyl-prolyl cis-trans isomerase n=1 Tax=Geminisphaera colitermitum TaxID=1148786 RepID=UPI000314C120|nr:FKBP-type peptidyl-prolyl cis-trans isomerase [Geminisphaera colitermitum]
MQLTDTLKLSLLALGLATGLQASDAPAATAETAEKPDAPASAPTYTEAETLEALGWFIGDRMIGQQFQLTKLTADQQAAILKGIKTSFDGQPGPDFEKVGPAIDQLLRTRQAAAQAVASEKGKAEAEKFFADLKQNPKVTFLPSGLAYEIIAESNGDKPKAADTVKVHYTGKLVDGTVFDSSVERGEPAEFPLNGVIPGWTEGLQLVGKGGKIKLYVPSELGYGAQGAGGKIPGFATLVFDVELLEITPAAAPASDKK